MLFQIESHKLEWNVASKVGSLDNARHVAGGGERKVGGEFSPNTDVGVSVEFALLTMCAVVGRKRKQDVWK